MDPNASTTNTSQPEKRSSKTVFFTLFSLLILATVVVITLFLYIKNKQTITKKQSEKEIVSNAKSEATVPKLCTNTKVYKSLQEALATPEKVCTLDLSFQNLNSLPNDIDKLNRLTSLYLTGNNFTKFPNQILQLESLVRLDINANPLTSLPLDMSNLKNLKILNIVNDKISNINPKFKMPPNIDEFLIVGNKISSESAQSIFRQKPNIIIGESKIEVTHTSTEKGDLH